jgi:hypothetical protein
MRELLQDPRVDINLRCPLSIDGIEVVVTPLEAAVYDRRVSVVKLVLASGRKFEVPHKKFILRDSAPPDKIFKTIL